MNAKVLLRDHDGSRTIALATPSKVLTFRPVFDGGNSGGGNGGGGSGSNDVLSAAARGDSTKNSPRCVVELLDSPPQAELSRRGYKTISHSVHGTLGLITVDHDVFLSVVSGASRAAVVRPGETVQKILGVDFYCLTRADFDDMLSADMSLLQYDNDDYYGEHEASRQQQSSQHAIEHPCLSLKKLLSGGSFYFSADFDLTSRIQDRAEGSDSGDNDFDAFEKGYLWNSYMIKPLVDFRSRLSGRERRQLDSTRLLTAAIRGFASTIVIPAPSSLAETRRVGLPSTLTLISRQSCLRAGTRFNARGVDDDGNVANFVESETVLWNPTGTCFSYVQVRGSIPVFWEQTAGLQQRINLTRSAQATQPAFDRHFDALEQKYGSVHVVNLLSKEKAAEIELSTRYRRHIEHASVNRQQQQLEAGDPNRRLIRSTEYDFHAETRGPDGYRAASMIKSQIIDSAEASGYCLTEVAEETVDKLDNDDPDDGSSNNNNEKGQQTLRRSLVVLQQLGVFRTNCLDCLDRTNLVQTIISQLALDAFLEHRGERMSSELLLRHNSAWADNGDALSKIYAGTGALKSSFTRSGKMSIAGALADARKSAQRLYINNFTDKARQVTMDTLLGRLVGQTPVYLFDPINDYVSSELARRAAEYSSTTEVSVWCGTLNLNGRTEGLNADLSSWLFASPSPASSMQQQQRQQTADGLHDIFAVGFQEIVELSPAQIMSTNPARRQAWEEAVKATLNARATKTSAARTDRYVLLRGGQLVGASLSIFVRASLLPRVKNVEGAVQKTGMSGMAGNKGAVAIRMDVSATSLCFVTAHLAAGFANYDERNRDYATIARQLRFQHGRHIDDHDNVVWLGDFNYRIGLPDGQVKELIAAGDLARLYENDQLNLQMLAGLVFPHYREARISFPPTYKYDVGTDTYDSSDKQRIPAWCDRVLHRGHGLRLLSYDHARQLRFSDHRPVHATFVCRVDIVDEARREGLARLLYERRKQTLVSGGLESLEMGPMDGAASANADLSDPDDDELLTGFGTSLPPASSDKRKWWLDNGMPARSIVQPPQTAGRQPAVLNPARPSNPWTPTEQTDWLTSSPPRKPVPGSGAAGSRDVVNTSADAERAPPLPIRSQAGSISRKPAPPPVPKKKQTLQSPGAGAKSPGNGFATGQQTGGNKSSRNVGLMDEDHDAAASSLDDWTPLQPS